MYVSCTREVIIKFLKRISRNFRAFIQVFGRQLSIFFYFVSVRSFLNENVERKKNPGKRDFTCSHFHPSRDYFQPYIYYYYADL